PPDTRGRRNFGRVDRGRTDRYRNPSQAHRRPAITQQSRRSHPMDIRVRRAALAATLAAFGLLSAWRAVPARAVSVDPELVAESVTEDGYYVDSGASYLKSDADLDKLRAALDNAGRAGVVVLPAGASSGPVISRLLQSPGHRATYIVLTGT